jgi:hypothetical protein
MGGDVLIFDAVYLKRRKLVLTVGRMFSLFHCVRALLLDVQFALVSCVRESYFAKINFSAPACFRTQVYKGLLLMYSDQEVVLPCLKCYLKTNARTLVTCDAELLMNKMA